jgi:hypothetical protein
VQDNCWITLERNLIHDFGGAMTMRQLAWSVCGVATLIATCISLFSIYCHCINYNMPSQQRYIIRILLSVPVYAIFHFFAFLFFQDSPYIESICDLYECILLASFLMLLYNYLTDDPIVISTGKLSDVTSMASSTKRPQVSLLGWHIDPSSSAALYVSRLLVLQNVIIRPCITLAGLIAHAYDRLCPGSFSPQHANIWTCMLSILSMIAAILSLSFIYKALRDEVDMHNLRLKFLSVQLVSKGVAVVGSVLTIM